MRTGRHASEQVSHQNWLKIVCIDLEDSVVNSGLFEDTRNQN